MGREKTNHSVVNRSSGDRRGLVLIAVLWTVTLLGLITAIMGRTTRLESKVSDARKQQLQCKWACRAGVETAAAVLNDDLKDSDGLTDLWSDSIEDFNDVELGQCSFNVSVVDEAGKLNINTATKKQLLELPEMTDEIAEAILDWRDKDDMPRAYGAEAGYYENVPFRYKIRNGEFQTIRELMLVKGVTRELLYGEDTNLNGMLDFNEKDGDASPPADDSDSELDKGWIAYLTCYSVDSDTNAYGERRININEADQKRLENGLRIGAPHAKWIVENRKKKYESIADLINDKTPKKAEEDSNTNRNTNTNSDEVKAQPLDLATFSTIADSITVGGEGNVPGKINVNTASKVVLAALLGGGDRGRRVADEIIIHRETLITPMQSIGDLLDVKSVNVKTFKTIANNITTRSNIYTVRCVAVAGGITVPGSVLHTEVVLDRSETPAKTLYRYQGVAN